MKKGERIIIEATEFKTFNVTFDGRVAEHLYFDEVLGLVSSITMPEDKYCLNWLWTEEQRKQYFEHLNNDKS